MAIMNPNDPIEIERYAWPTAALDPVAKMRALAAGLPHVASNEAVFDVPFDRFWEFIVDFENNTARIEGTVTRVRILDRQDERLRLEARSVIGLWDEFDVVLRPGWCVMRARSGQVGMAAHPEGPTQTRYFHFEGSPIFGRLARPFFAWNIRQDFRRLRKFLLSSSHQG
jgi:hypothetical protein